MSLLAKWSRLCLMTVVMGILPLAAISARDLTSAERAALAQTVERFNGLMNTQDWQAMVETTIPPRIMDHMLARSGATKEQMLKSIAALMAETMAKVTIDSYAMDLAKSAEKELADGTPYVLVPTETVVKVEQGDRIAIRSHTLAMMDTEKWYLLRISDPKQVDMLVQVYPEYKGIEFPGDKTEILKE